MNDCLFKAIQKIIGFYRLPRGIKAAEDFKTFLKIKTHKEKIKQQQKKVI